MVCLRLSLLSLLHLVSNSFCWKQFDDSTLFKISWPGDSPSSELLKKFHENALTPEEAIVVTTENHEQFLCSIPMDLDDLGNTGTLSYTGPTPNDLLQPMYTQRSCTYRIEMYWTYELCHGRYILQYHEEKDNSRRSIRQEYYLGQFVDQDAHDDKYNHLEPPKRKVDDEMLPYFPVKYNQGTRCDINNKPRLTTVFYVCVPDGKNQIYSLDEISSCEYEVVVLTPVLCTHPAFKGKQIKEHKVECIPADGKKKAKPTALTVWERDQQWQYLKHLNKRTVLISKEAFDDDGDQDDDEVSEPGTHDATESAPTSAKYENVKKDAPAPVDQSLVNSFLAGDYCLYGGGGWWKHEYCHGKQVLQFHEDPNTGKLQVLLGKWNQDAHILWMKDKSHKKPIVVDGKVKQISHLYTGGDMCDLTRKPRQVEVRLRCKETKGNANAVSLYLLEPKTCEYVLGVESGLFCELLQKADENGLFKR